MSSLLIAYDLRKPGKDYSQIIAAIKQYGTWAHLEESVWAIRTASTPASVRDALLKHIDENDRLLVAEPTGNAAWHNLNPEVGTWLQKNLAA